MDPHFKFSTASQQLCTFLEKKYSDVINFNPIEQFFSNESKEVSLAMLPKNIAAAQNFKNRNSVQSFLSQNPPIKNDIFTFPVLKKERRSNL